MNEYRVAMPTAGVEELSIVNKN